MEGGGGGGQQIQITEAGSSSFRHVVHRIMTW